VCAPPTAVPCLSRSPPCCCSTVMFQGRTSWLYCSALGLFCSMTWQRTVYPGAAWQPGSCHIGQGHTGPVSSTLEVVFRCPPEDLVGCLAGTAAAAAAATPAADEACAGAGSRRSSVDITSSGLPSQAGRRVPSRRFSSTSVESNTTASPGINTTSSSSSSKAGTGCHSQRPPGGGAVPLLLTGGSDGSVRAWDLRAAHLGQAWMTVHPHTGESWAPAVSGSTLRFPKVSWRLLRGGWG